MGTVNKEELMSLKPCIQCGYCCTVAPCMYGQWIKPRGPCRYLTKDNKCSKYEEICRAEASMKYQMFGSGCSSTMFNDIRDNKLKEGQHHESDTTS